MKILFRVIVVFVLVGASLLAWFTRDTSGPIPNDLPDSALAEVASFIGSPFEAQPISVPLLPSHPFLARQGLNSIHNDSHQSDSYPWAGPSGSKPQVDSARFHPLVGSCVSAVINSQGQMISTCVTPFGVTLVARDPASLAILARKKITHWWPVGSKFGGGVYFHQDHEGRVLLASNEPAIELWQLLRSGDSFSWHKEQSIPLAQVLDDAASADHRVIDVMPDWQGNYWFITREGLVGVSDREGQRVRVMTLEGEGIDNALAVSEQGVFVVSDHAMYRFNIAADGSPEVDWRATYDRGPAPKPGTIGHGSGTTPTLVGNDFVAITDNAAGRINVVVYRQQPLAGESPLFCEVPVFEADKGTSENSMVAIGHSLVVENNFGYQGPFDNISAEPGLARINIDIENGGCAVAWENNSISSPSSVPKASMATGLIYVYTRDPSNPEDMQAWYFTALDARTGELAFKVLTGVGKGFNNHYGSISIMPDGAAYVGVIGGVVKVWDAE